MNEQDALRLISESLRFLEAYRAFGPVVVEGIGQLEKLEGLVRSGENGEARILVSSMCAQISPYRDLVPEFASNLEQIRDILVESKSA